MRSPLVITLAVAAALLPAAAQNADPRAEALVERLEKAVTRAEAAADRLEKLAAGAGTTSGGVNAGANEQRPADIKPEDVHAALKRQLECLDDCKGTRVAVTAFTGVTFGEWRHPTAGDLVFSIGAFDGWLIPAKVTFQTRRYYNDQTVVQDNVWDVKLYRADGGVVTFYDSGYGSTSKTKETHEGPQLPPSP